MAWVGDFDCWCLILGAVGLALVGVQLWLHDFDLDELFFGKKEDK